MSDPTRITTFNALVTSLGADPQSVDMPTRRTIHDAALAYARACGYRPPTEEQRPATRRKEPAAEVEDFAMPFGRDKGRMLSTLDVRSLQWWEGVFRRDLEDPEKARFHARAQKQLDAVRACLRSRGEAASYGD